MLTFQPIGIVYSDHSEKVLAPRQSAAAQGRPGRIELYPGRNFEHALDDLAGWERIWVVFLFHLNEGWRPKVLPPRSQSGRKGVFSTRSPHRPNPIGLSAVRLERIEGLTLHILDVDMVDGTPVLDIKPYVPYTDAFPEAKSGWLQAADPLPDWVVKFDSLSEDQLQWIEQREGPGLRNRIATALALGPRPNPYRRIKREGTDYQLAIKDWRVRFVEEGRTLRVVAIASGYRKGAKPAIHIEFLERWPGGCRFADS